MSTATGGHTGRALYTGLTALGSNQATALALAGRGDSIQEITTVASSTGVLLPPIVLPMRVEIVNQGASTLSIYPQLGGTIDNGSTNAAVTLASGKAAIYEASSLTNWYTVSSTSGGLVTTGLEFDQSKSLITADTQSAGTFTFNLATANWHSGTLASNATLVASGGVVGQQFTLRLQQAASGGPFSISTWFSAYTITWLTSSFSAPSMPTSANGVLVVTFKITGSNTMDGFSCGTSST
jgi:hypothetical protein